MPGALHGPQEQGQTCLVCSSSDALLPPPPPSTSFTSPPFPRASHTHTGQATRSPSRRCPGWVPCARSQQPHACCSPHLNVQIPPLPTSHTSAGSSELSFRHLQEVFTGLPKISYPLCSESTLYCLSWNHFFQQIFTELPLCFRYCSSH